LNVAERHDPHVRGLRLQSNARLLWLVRGIEEAEIVPSGSWQQSRHLLAVGFELDHRGCGAERCPPSRHDGKQDRLGGAPHAPRLPVAGVEEEAVATPVATRA